MSVRKYKTSKGLRYAVEMYQDGQRLCKGGFTSRLEAHRWEKNVKEFTIKQKNTALYEAITLYLQGREGRCKRNTLIYKKSVLKKFTKFIGPTVDFEKVTRQDIEKFLKNSALTVSEKSANKYRIELSALYVWAIREGYAAVNIPRQTEQFSTTKTVKYVPPHEDVKRIMDSATGMELDFLICILHTAGRISEIRELAWEDVSFNAMTVRLWTSKRRGGNRESRTIAMSKTLNDTLSRRYEYRTNAGLYVFENGTTGLPYTRTSPRIKNMMKRLCDKADVQFFTAHSLRHFIATHFNDPHRAQKILGHMNLKTTELYLHELGVDRGAADVFEAITYKITYGSQNDKKKGPTILQ